MKPFFRINFLYKDGASIDEQRFQEATRFPLAWRVHFDFCACASDVDISDNPYRFEDARIQVRIARCSFVTRSGDFAWRVFHAFLEKLENRLGRYGFVADATWWTSTGNDYRPSESETATFIHNGVYILLNKD